MVSDEEYARRYQAWRDSVADGETFPALGDSIQLTPRDGERIVAPFAGFSYRHVMIRSGSGEGYGGLSFENLLSISGSAGDPIPVERLIAQDVSGSLPSRTALKLRSGRDTVTTALDQIVNVSVGVPRHGARNGFLIGLVADVIILAVVAATYDPPSSSSDCDASGWGQDYSWFEEPFDTWTGRPLSGSEWAAIRSAADSSWVTGVDEPVASEIVPDATR